MNGAEQGEAMTTASTPDNASLTKGFFAFQPASDDGSNTRISNRPDRFSASTKKSRARPATTAGDCSWKPQPSCAPAARSATSSAASSQNETMTPAANARPCLRIVARPPPCAAKPRTLSDSTGNTQGIRLSSKPPSRASAIAAPSDSALSAGTSGSGCGEDAAGSAAATTVPASGTSICAVRSLPPSPAVDSSTPARRVNSPTRCTATGSESVQRVPSRESSCAPLGSICPALYAKKRSLPTSAGADAPGGGVNTRSTTEPLAVALAFQPSSARGNDARVLAIAALQRDSAGAGALPFG